MRRCKKSVWTVTSGFNSKEADGLLTLSWRELQPFTTGTILQYNIEKLQRLQTFTLTFLWFLWSHFLSGSTKKLAVMKYLPEKYAR
jgi:hypothetical protein